MLAIGLHPPPIAQRASACSLHSHYAPPHFQSCSKAYDCVLLEVNLGYMKQRGKNNWSPIPEYCI